MSHAAPDQTPALPTSSDPVPRPSSARPGWPEVAVVTAVYAVLVGAGVLWIWQLPDDQAAFRGIVGYVVSGAAGLGAFGAAFALRFRDVRVFGLGGTSWRWLLLGAGLGVAVYVLNLGTASAYIAAFGNDNPQADYHAAASGGLLSLVVAVFAGAVLTPIGEELAFRSVIANALNRYGAWAGIVLSSAVFALAHGVNIILPLAFVVGLVCALLFRRTGSVWPGVLVHAVYNGISNVVFMLVATG